MLQFWQVNSDINVTMSDGSRVMEVHWGPRTAREASSMLNLISIFAYWNLGRWSSWIICPAVRKEESSQSLGDCQPGSCISPSAVGICWLTLLGFLHAATTCSDELWAQGAWRLWQVDLSLFSPIPSRPESSQGWECLCPDTVQGSLRAWLSPLAGVGQNWFSVCQALFYSFQGIYFNMGSSRHRIRWISASKGLVTSTKTYFPNLVYDLLKLSIWNRLQAATIELLLKPGMLGWFSSYYSFILLPSLPLNCCAN